MDSTFLEQLSDVRRHLLGNVRSGARLSRDKPDDVVMSQPTNRKYVPTVVQLLKSTYNCTGRKGISKC
jgi:hypothetical protein